MTFIEMQKALSVFRAKRELEIAGEEWEQKPFCKKAIKKLNKAMKAVEDVLRRAKP